MSPRVENQKTPTASPIRPTRIPKSGVGVLARFDRPSLSHPTTQAFVRRINSIGVPSLVRYRASSTHRRRLTSPRLVAAPNGRRAAPTMVDCSCPSVMFVVIFDCKSNFIFSDDRHSFIALSRAESIQRSRESNRRVHRIVQLWQV